MSHSFKQEEFEAILGRPLSDAENQMFKATLADAIDAVKAKLGVDWDATGAMTYVATGSLPYVATEPFTTLYLVKLNGKVLSVSDYFATWNDDRNGRVKNSISFRRPLAYGDEVEVSAAWGYGGQLPLAIKRMIVGTWLGVVQPLASMANPTVKSKSIEDFSVSYDVSTVEQRVGIKFNDVIAEYSRRAEPVIDHSMTMGCRTRCRGDYGYF